MADAIATAIVLVRLGDPGGPRKAQRYTQPTSDNARRRGPAIRTARRGSNSHLARTARIEVLIQTNSQVARGSPIQGIAEL